MKKYVIVLLSAISAMLVLGSTHSIFADEDVTDTHIDVPYVDAGKFFSGEDSKYQLHVQVTVRSSDNQLISVTESTGGLYLDHKITDKAFDTMLGEKEIVTINNTKYEKVQFTFSPGLEQRYMAVYPIFSEFKIEVDFSDEVITKMHEEDLVRNNWRLHYCANFGEVHGSTCVSMFICNIPTVTLQPSDTTTQQWTILRMMN